MCTYRGEQMPAMGYVSPRLDRQNPYAFTIVVLVIGSREAMRKRIGAPAALGVPYIRSEKA